MRTFVSAKIHGIRVTGKGVVYHGSVTIDRQLLAAASIAPYEQVHVVNLANGSRWITYAIPGGPGVFELNGGGAYLGNVGDACIVLSYTTGQDFAGAKVIFINDQNKVAEQLTYA